MSKSVLRRIGGAAHGARAARLCAVALLGVCALAIAACGGSSKSSSTTGSAAPSTGTTASNPAKGSPVLIGIVNPTSQPEFADGVKASIKYLNAEQNGLNGHRIEVQVCASDPTPQQDIQCANTFVRAHVAAVVLGEDYTSDTAFPIYQRAGIPNLVPRVLANQELVNPVAVALGPGVPGLLSAVAGYSKETQHATTSGTVSAPVDAGLKSLVDGPLASAGIKNSWTYYAEENPDFTSTFAAAAGKKPDFILLDIDANTQCIPAMKALQSIGATFKVFQVLCSDDEVQKAAGSLADGEIFYAPTDSVAGVQTADTRTFEHIMQTYSTTKSTGYNASVAAAATVTLARVLKHQGGDVTPRSILAAFAGSKGVDLFMGPELQCGDYKGFPRLCMASMRFFTPDNGRKKVLSDWVKYPQYFPKG